MSFSTKGGGVLGYGSRRVRSRFRGFHIADGFIL